MNKIEWCIEQHRKTNHFYDAYLPYEFHLRMVDNVCKDFIHLLPNEAYFEIDENSVKGAIDNLKNVVGIAVWGHDLIEDCRISYNDCKQNLGQGPADIIYAVTNEKGKSRKERAGDKYYEGICNTKGAAFVKLCDRIANVQYSKLTKSRMFEMYKKENYLFVEKLFVIEFDTMFKYLNNLFEE
jgi:(p)ppGpp synthase/HD superfamily hydrolase